MNPILYLIIPCYNEQEVLPETARRLKEKMERLKGAEKISGQSRIVFVNDGSSDQTWNLILDLHKRDTLFSGINLSRNEGHQNALFAGLMTVKADADIVISMDADLQDDIQAIDEMLERYKAGCDIVYGVRSSRKTDHFFKRVTAQGFYRLMNWMGANTIYNHADYRLMSRRAIDGLAQFEEVNLFLRGMVPMVGYPSDIVYYQRKERFAGESKYPLRKMVSFAVEGITSLSTRPIKMITLLGILVFMMSIFILIYSVFRHFIGATVTGWTTLMISLWGIGGLILLSLGIIGEYIGKIYMETKHRPKYLLDTYLEQEKDKKTANESSPDK